MTLWIFYVVGGQRKHVRTQKLDNNYYYEKKKRKNYYNEKKKKIRK